MRRFATNIFKVLVLVVLPLMNKTVVCAQTSDVPNNIQLYGTAYSYKGELGNQFWKKTEKGIGVAYNRYLTSAFDLGFNLVYNSPDFYLDPPNNFLTDQIAIAMVNTRFKLNGTLFHEDAFIGPYLNFGAGGMYVSAEGASDGIEFDDRFVTTVLAGGAGIRFMITDGFNIFVESNYQFTGNDRFDWKSSGVNDRFLEHKAGIGLNLGKGKDSDKDGVPDRRDKCPRTPAGVQVNRNGCPVDTDGDGVADYQDECPTEAGVASLKGCPDRDNDGVADKNDECPDEAGTVATKGCPDSDGDGVADKNDKCPNTPAGVQVGADGCPVDSDGDGVADNEDACPNTPGPGTANGCPEVDARTKKLIEEKTRFEFNKAIVQPNYKQLLDSIIVALEKYPDHVLLIKGHADFIGSEDYNQVLSERRAEAVKEYLVQRGVKNPDRLVTRGYGESQPLVKVNQRLSKRRTEAARRINRRVGFELNTPDLKLNKE